MKLVIVMGVEASKPDIRKLFTEGGVTLYSEVEIQGHRMPSLVPNPDNWFGSRDMTVYSTMAFAFVDAAKAQSVLTAVKAFNESGPTNYPLHAFQLVVEGGV